MNIITANEGESLDAVCYRFYGSSNNLETVLKANPHIAELSERLPHGTTIKLPPLAPSAAITTINLWD